MFRGIDASPNIKTLKSKTPYNNPVRFHPRHKNPFKKHLPKRTYISSTIHHPSYHNHNITTSHPSPNKPFQQPQRPTANPSLIAGAGTPYGLLSRRSKKSLGPWRESGYSSTQPVEMDLQKDFRHANMVNGKTVTGR